MAQALQTAVGGIVPCMALVVTRSTGWGRCTPWRLTAPGRSARPAHVIRHADRVDGQDMCVCGRALGECLPCAAACKPTPQSRRHAWSAGNAVPILRSPAHLGQIVLVILLCRVVLTHWLWDACVGVALACCWSRRKTSLTGLAAPSKRILRPPTAPPLTGSYRTRLQCLTQGKPDSPQTDIIPPAPSRS